MIPLGRRNIGTPDYRSDPILGPTLAYWDEVRGNRFAPRRADIKASCLRDQLRHLQFIDVVRSPDVQTLRFRYRMIGTRLVQAFGCEFAGKFVDDLFAGDKARFFNELYGEICDLRRPLFVRCKYKTAKGLEIASDRLYLPLSEDGATVTMIMGVLLFQSQYFFDGEWSAAEVDVHAVEKEVVDLSL